MVQLAAAVVFVVLMMASPAEALAAARQAISVWADSFVPALLPFFAVTPALSTDEAARLYARLFGRAFEALFGCPGRLAGAAMIGLMAGSPAGAVAAGRLREGATRAELTRGALLASGVSPGFLISAVGTAMLGDAGLGAVLLRAQLGALVVGGLMLRRAFSGGALLPPPEMAEEKKNDALMGAALSMLSVCAHMVVFAVAAHVVAEVLPAGCETGVLAVMEVSGGSAAIAALALPRTVRMVLLALSCGFGGLAIMAQNLRRLPGVRWGHYLAGKLMHATIAAALCWAQLGAAPPEMPPFSAWRAPLLMASALVVLTAAGVFFLRRAWYNPGIRKKG